MTRRHLLLTISLLCLTAAARAQNGGTPAEASVGTTGAALTFIKDFPGSYPPYYAIKLMDVGGEKYVAEYRIEPEEDPTELSIDAPLAQHAFALSKELAYFAGPKIESGRMVAQMGKKTLRYENGATRGEAIYNHTELPEIGRAHV